MYTNIIKYGINNLNWCFNVARQIINMFKWISKLSCPNNLKTMLRIWVHCQSDILDGLWLFTVIIKTCFKKIKIDFKF